MANLTREQILARKLGKGLATLPDGSTVGIRAATRDEVIVMQGCARLADADNYLISTCMIDPKMTEEEVAAWAAADEAGSLTVVSDEIAKLSKLYDGAGKGAYKSPGR
jgi:hypothetical protein